MKKGYIRIPINEVWELINKPWRFYKYLSEEIEKLPISDEYELLDFDEEIKKEMVKKIYEIGYPPPPKKGTHD